MQTEKQSQFEKLEHRLRTLHSRFQDTYENSTKRFTLLKDQLLKLESQIEQQQLARDELMQQKSSELENL